MKKLTQLLILLVGFTGGMQYMNAQTLVGVCDGDQVCLTADAYRGSLQWQESADAVTWTDISGAVTDTFCFTPSANGFFRAEISEGNCDPWYSDTMEIEISMITADAGADTYGCANGAAAVGGAPTGSNGFGSLSYLWSSGDTAANPSIQLGSASSAYSVTVTDAAGCTASDTVQVTIVPIVASAGPDTSGCTGSPLTIGGAPSGSGGVGALSYAWSSGDTIANPSILVGSSPQSYVLTVTDSLGCMAMDTVLVDTGGSAIPGSTTFSYTGGVQTFVVPPCVFSIDVDVRGAQGGANWQNNNNFGGRVQGTVPVTPGETLYVYVGQQPNSTSGGWNGGGNGENSGQGGGGASDIRQGGQTLNDRVVVAGGGGGAGYWSGQHVVGGVGGGLTGGDGYRQTPTTYGGQGGTQTSSGTGTCSTFNNPSVSGGFGFGGSASGCGCEGYGGGGGWYGGAGSGNCRGGGGGSGYTATGVTNVTHTSGARSGNGIIIITW